MAEVVVVPIVRREVAELQASRDAPGAAVRPALTANAVKGILKYTASCRRR
jgi:hypothetical protein